MVTCAQAALAQEEEERCLRQEVARLLLEEEKKDSSGSVHDPMPSKDNPPVWAVTIVGRIEEFSRHFDKIYADMDDIRGQVGIQKLEEEPVSKRAEFTEG
ncbi:hypothetical protein CDL15_Pgr026198 [Punica granatum]|uniref:Uncharacterized protein n=1 Tax=Punica granatum TaxID=22663 RepID=A0A218VR55_PUNGR|nr:hypothetical protein CDL15_Pgr026198 [Punica granatum]